MSSIVPTELTDAHWRALHELAVEAMTHAYAPYSRFKVGAAALVDDGRLVSGCNVENAGYGVTLCAECGLVSELTRTGGGLLVAFSCVDAHGRALAPCGRCRQLIYEHGGPSCLVLMPDGVAPMTEVLPGAFGPHDLSIVAQAAAASSEEKEGHDGSL